MYVSWSDLNNVQEAGDYPFRDGRVTVTFAEIATWKDNPHATFLLMRKNPVQGIPSYVLGQQLEDRSGPAIAQTFYQSSNGDSWSLSRDRTSGAPVVIHTANIQSGGHVSHIDVDRFLAGDANGPEHQALKHLLESTSATILIAYDIHPFRGGAYDELTTAIQSLGAWWHHLETVWIVRTARRPDEIHDRLKPYIGADDQLLVIDVSGDTAVWTGVSDAGSAWLHKYIVHGNTAAADA
jgi:hypothetical protein